MSEPGCFLCSPDPDLIVRQAGAAYAMAGLGPITSTYAILASRAHLPSLADLAVVAPSAIREIERLRDELESVRGPLLLTEHGRVPICRSDGDQHERHCFHAHGLVFAHAPSVVASARTFYSNSDCYRDLSSALAQAARHSTYLLISDAPDSFNILSGSLNAPRQLARTLAALAVGEAALADWRTSPRRAEAETMAETLRAALEKQA